MRTYSVMLDRAGLGARKRARSCEQTAVWRQPVAPLSRRSAESAKTAASLESSTRNPKFHTLPLHRLGDCFRRSLQQPFRRCFRRCFRASFQPSYRARFQPSFRLSSDRSFRAGFPRSFRPSLRLPSGRSFRPCFPASSRWSLRLSFRLSFRPGFDPSVQMAKPPRYQDTKRTVLD
jgi:hypothetical protein